MGSGSSRFVALSDVSRVRDWLLVVLRHRVHAEQSIGAQQSLRDVLTALFARHDADGSGNVAASVVAEIALELSLQSPSKPWTTDEMDQFCAFFAPESIDSSSMAFDYGLFLDYLFFPVQQAPPRVEISPGDMGVADFQVGVLSVYERPGQRPVKKTVTVKAVARSGAVDGRAETLELLRDAVNSLRLLSHPNLVRYCSTLQSDSVLYVLQSHEHKSCSLRTILESFGPMKESTVRRYVGQLLQGLLYLHQHGIPHGALSAQSVLIDSYGLLKLSDFGICRHSPSSELWERSPELPAAGVDVSDWCVQYKPPEIDTQAAWGLKSDVWSVGILALQMTHGLRSPSTAPPASASKELKAMVRACLHKRPSKRPTVSELLRAPYFRVDQTEATREELRTVCTDLDASMRRLLSASSPATRAGVRKDAHNRRATTGRGR